MTPSEAAKAALWEWIKAHARSEADAQRAAELVKGVLKHRLRDAGIELLKKVKLDQDPK